MPTRLILIRHGETSWNLQKRYLGRADIGLNDKGIKQARSLGRRLGKEKIHKVYSSDARRALKFAGIAFKGLTITKAPGLKEMDFGIFEGMTYEQIMRKYPEIYSNWLRSPFKTVIPEGEDLNDFRKRVMKIFKKIIALNRNKTFVIVTHAGPIRVIIGDILKPGSIWDRTPDLAGINIIEFKKREAKNGKTYIYFRQGEKRKKPVCRKTGYGEGY